MIVMMLWVIKSFEEIYKEAETKFKFENIAVFIEHIKGYAALGDTSIINCCCL